MVEKSQQRETKRGICLRLASGMIFLNPKEVDVLAMESAEFYPQPPINWGTRTFSDDPEFPSRL